MIEWEEKNEISSKVKGKRSKQKKARQRSKKKHVLKSADKENIHPLGMQSEETKKEKEVRIQELAEFKISEWIRSKTKEGWLSLKNN